MQEGMYYWKTCVSGGRVFHENMCYGSTWAYLAGLCRSNHLSCCEFRHLVIFFPYSISFICWQTCFPRIYCLNSSFWVCRFIFVAFFS